MMASTSCQGGRRRETLRLRRWGGLPSVVATVVVAALQVAADDAPPTATATPPTDAAALLFTGPADPFASGTVLQARKLRGLRAEVATLILKAEPGGRILSEVLATPLPGSGGRAQVPLFVEIDGPSFLEQNQASTARIEVYAYALQGASVAGYLAEAFAVDVSALGEAIWQSGLKYFGHLELAPGDYQLRVLVRNYQSGAGSLRQVTLSVPDFAAGVPFLLPPIAPGPESRDSWVPVREWEPAGSYPFVDGEQVLRPAVRPVLVAEREAEVHLFAYGLPPGTTGGRLELLRDDHLAGEAPLEVVHRRPAGPDGVETLAARFELPGVEPGEYSLRARWETGSERPLTSASLRSFVLDATSREPEVLWTDLRWLFASDRSAEAATAEAQRAPSPEPKRRRNKRAIERLSTAYRQVLASMGGPGGHAAARTALFELESQTLAGQSRETLDTLQAAELALAEELAAAQAETLIPVLMLHDDLYRVYRERQLFSLVSHTRSLIELYAELYAERGGTTGSRIVAARVLASLAGYLQDAELPASSRRLFRRALELDPRNQAALLGLAASHERYGDYSRAVGYLETLAAQYPTFSEGLLRLAINDRRLGRRQLAHDTLERVLAATDAPAWVRALGYQELARGLIETGALAAAEELLTHALDELPQQHGCMLLLAHVYDRRGRPGAALTLLDGLRPTADDSARRRYDSWPTAPLAEARRQLAEAGEVRRATLTELLAHETSENRG